MPGTAMTDCGMPASSSASSKSHSTPAAWMRRPSGRIVVVLSAGSGPADFTASPVGSETVHAEGVAAGYFPSQAPQPSS